MDIRQEVNQILDQILEKINYQEGDVFVVGCSSSEVIGKTIGKHSSYEVGQEIFLSLHERLSMEGIHLASQCCEHLNRALVVERSLAKEKGWEIVSVIPQANAGGSFATAAYKHLEDPVLVEFIKADFGLDIGDTFIGMHIKHVCVPLRIEKKSLGQAHITMAYSRPKLIGGQRAIYE